MTHYDNSMQQYTNNIKEPRAKLFPCLDSNSRSIKNMQGIDQIRYLATNSLPVAAKVQIVSFDWYFVNSLLVVLQPKYFGSSLR